MTCLVGNVTVVFVVKGAEGRWHIFELILDTILIWDQRSGSPNGYRTVTSLFPADIFPPHYVEPVVFVLAVIDIKGS